MVGGNRMVEWRLTTQSILDEQILEDCSGSEEVFRMGTKR